jgi:hypothetical protein
MVAPGYDRRAGRASGYLALPPDTYVTLVRPAGGCTRDPGLHRVLHAPFRFAREAERTLSVSVAGPARLIRACWHDVREEVTLCVSDT